MNDQKSTISIRELRPDDAERFVNLLEQTDMEADYLLFEPGERLTSAGKERVRINWWRDSPNSAILGAVKTAGGNGKNGPELIGYLFASGGSAARNRHVMTIEGIAVLKEHQNTGVGKRLLDEAERLARAEGIVRLGLGVMEPNAAARALYKKAGFIEEARRDKAFLLDGDYIAQIELVKFLDQD